MKTGRPMRIGKILPGSQYLEATKLSQAANMRLKWMDYYNKSGCNASLTARRFGISRMTLHKWLKRYQPNNLLSLEGRSKAPKRRRKPTTPAEVVGTIKTLRRNNPEYSKYKLAIILKRDFNLGVSASTIGRIIKRYQLFAVKQPKRYRRPPRRLTPEKVIKPFGLTAEAAREVFEFDAKHLRTFAGRKHYAFVTVDIFTKQTCIQISSSISSKQASYAWQMALKRLGQPQIVVTDHGSENLGAFAKRLESSSTTHFFARVGHPKDKPFVERVIGSFETECLALGGLADTVADQQKIANAWLAKYHYYRPHEALNYLTPQQFSAKLKTACKV